MTRPFQLKLVMENIEGQCPNGVPMQFWQLFVAEADKIRAMGRAHYGARTIAEYLRHNAAMKKEGEFLINNNWTPFCAVAYMNLRNFWKFFSIRGEKQPL